MTILLSLFAAVMEGIGVGFIAPVIELIQSSSSTASSDNGKLDVFARAYELLGVPFTFETALVGLGIVLSMRFTTSFAAGWLRWAFRMKYIRTLRTRLFNDVLMTRRSLIEKHGSEEILNLITVQAKECGNQVTRLVRLVDTGGMVLVYLLLAFYLSVPLTLVAIVILGGLVFLVRHVLEPGYVVGEKQADATERIQTIAQNSILGLHEVKMYGMIPAKVREFSGQAREHENRTVHLKRNETGIQSFYRLASALMIFTLMYIGIEQFSLQLSSLGVFLFAMLRLGPRLSSMTNYWYKLEGDTPYLLRVQRFIEQLEAEREPQSGESVPDPVESVTFEDVTFGYDDEDILRDVSLRVNRGEFVALVGPSGAGKSTTVSLLTREYTADEGTVHANGTPIEQFDLAEWRSTIAVVRQQPFIFNDTLWYNITLGDPDASVETIEQACDIAQVTAFLDELPDGYDTELGENGVKLSGGQRQRVALARAFLKNADLLVLDEATSDLDRTTEQRIQNRIEELDSEYGLLTIAHRLSTVKNADRIYTFDNGRIVEAGDHAELLDEDGKYADLYSK